jgi:dihydroorotate dehydrogenase
MYPLLKPFLFRLDPERAHDLVMDNLARASRSAAALRILSLTCQVRDARLEVNRFGLRFPNPVGLAAGLDKNARAVPVWPALGFGFTEVGSVTAHAQPGNPQPRLFRLPEEEALINRMGFNNDGAELVAARLERLFREQGQPATPLGINLGKSKMTPLDEAPEDYRRSLDLLWPYADYVVINVSSPNTPGLRELQERDRLEVLLQSVQGYAQERMPTKPVLLKIAPDLTWSQVDEIIELALACGIAGIIATNTTVSREGLTTSIEEAGGLSGRPLRPRALEFLCYLRRALGTRMPVVSVGGLFGPDDLYARLRAGASLVQIYTSFIYRGPLLVRNLNRGLLERLELDGFTSAEEAIGVDATAS